MNAGLEGWGWWGATLVGCALVASMALVGPLLLRTAVQRQRWIPPLIALAIGVLAGDALLHLVPHAVDAMGLAPTVMLAAAGFGLFATLRRLLPSAVRPAGTAAVSLGGDALHNLGDGLLIALAFATSPVLGIATVVAILAHELPQELGDYAILVDAGYSPREAAGANLGSAASVFVGALAGLVAGPAAEPALQWLSPVAAGGFLYLALFALLPGLRRHPAQGARWWRLRALPVAMGVGAMAGLAVAETRAGLDHGHVHGINSPAEAPRNFAPWPRG
ncbi:ZIP family metal transporter [Silanimonas sp.]|uniref:ZIP family metal transporter n=1 Tax=Silanimonas sp. TaxID=1929290 RepID=UPI0022CCBF75|nr:ZIP family metal transporter [Silanimonas sp.]MCZ8063622.1 ZIP family metal transporter [Silanimonas sp.]